VEAAADRTLRADAARNRERVLEAAGRVFSESGLDASVAEVAKAAGVGKATVFRSYPTKEHLIAAVACERVSWVAEAAREALAGADAWRAFCDLLDKMAVRNAGDAIHFDALTHAGNSPDLERARADANAAITALMDRAKAQGAMRADATADDLRVLFKGVTAALPAGRRHDAGEWRRWARMFASALRA
jgi:AcrR family transcriptional regulator